MDAYVRGVLGITGRELELLKSNYLKSER